MDLTEYEVPTRDPSNGYLANALTIAIDPVDNNKVWFTEFNHDKIGIVDRSVPIPFDIRLSTNMNMTNTILLPNIETQTQHKKAIDLSLEISRNTNCCRHYPPLNSS